MNLCKNVLIYEIHESQTRLILDPSTRISGKNHVLKIKKKKKLLWNMDQRKTRINFYWTNAEN
jgi:hypothetical protein